MVGTVYRAPSPDAQPFVRDGDRVKKGQVVCIIEAMKPANEIGIQGRRARGEGARRERATGRVRPATVPLGAPSSPAPARCSADPLGQLFRTVPSGARSARMTASAASPPPVSAWPRLRRPAPPHPLAPAPAKRRLTLAWVNMALALVLVARCRRSPSDALVGRAAPGPALDPRRVPSAAAESTPLPDPDPPEGSPPAAAGPAGDDGRRPRGEGSLRPLPARDIATACSATSARRASGREESGARSTVLARLGRDAYQAARHAEAVDHYRRPWTRRPDTAPTGAHWPSRARRRGRPRRGAVVLAQALRVPGRSGPSSTCSPTSRSAGGERARRWRPCAAARPEPNHAPAGRTLLTRLEREQGVEGGTGAREPALRRPPRGGGGIEVGGRRPIARACV
jgi:hypothetical protein